MRHPLGLPPFCNSYYDGRLRYDLDEELIFVFGSNEKGIHGAGAARDAVMHYGAHYGNPSGMQGQSYAIPTKDKHIRTLPLTDIALYVEEFRAHALETTEHYFFITAVGCGLAGYRAHNIAPMFRGLHHCWFPNDWKPYLESSPLHQQKLTT